MKNRVCDILGIKYPIIQGGMAWVADAELAASVSNAGGLGIIAGMNLDKESLRKEIRKIKTLTDKPFAVNVMMLSPHVDDVSDLVIEENVPIVTTGAGSPERYMPKWLEKGIKVIPVIAQVKHGVRLEKAGATALIAEGLEAGGHIGTLTTMTFVPMLKDAVSIPVIAAGGIGDERGYLAAFVLGAEAIQVGTRFLTSSDANISEVYKNMVVEAKDNSTIITGVKSGHPVRSLTSPLTLKFAELEKQDGVDPDIFEKLGTGSFRKAAKDGDIENGSFMAGIASGLCNRIQSSQEIIEDYTRGFEELVRKIKEWDL